MYVRQTAIKGLIESHARINTVEIKTFSLSLALTNNAEEKTVTKMWMI